jgi:tetratricopeptide (TPR) repeat protein
MQKLVDENPGVVDFRATLAIGHNNLGKLLLQVGEPAQAEAECQTAIAILQKLVDENRANAFYREVLVYARRNLGDVVHSQGRPAEAKRSYEQAIAQIEARGHEAPMDLMLHYLNMVQLVRGRGLTRGELGDMAGAADDARRALEMSEGLSPSPWNLFQTACCHAALAGLAGRAGSGVSAAEGSEEATRAIESLRRAVGVGYRNANEVRIESALDPLRSRDDFRLIMMDLAFPVEPFALTEPIP